MPKKSKVLRPTVQHVELAHLFMQRLEEDQAFARLARILHRESSDEEIVRCVKEICQDDVAELRVLDAISRSCHILNLAEEMKIETSSKKISEYNMISLEGSIQCLERYATKFNRISEEHFKPNSELYDTFDKSRAFYSSAPWRFVRYQVLREAKGCCQCCGKRASFESPLHVDHIKSRHRYPELSLDVKNLQVLCEDCNFGKGVDDETDWRDGKIPDPFGTEGPA